MQNDPYNPFLLFDRKPATRKAQAVLSVKARQRARWKQSRLFFSGVVVIIITGLMLLSFVDFAARIYHQPIPRHFKADSIVVLTGGPARMQVAFNLLREGRARRMLVTGVNERASASSLIASYDIERDLFACCIDLGYRAVNTVGNAIEAADWLDNRDDKLVLIVTSAYHLPRALAEFRHRLPERRLIGYPVFPDTKARLNWWQDKAALRVLFVEYLKYGYAKVRLGALTFYENYTS